MSFSILPSHPGQGHWFFQKTKEYNRFLNYFTQTVNLAKSSGNLAIEHTTLNFKYE